MRLGFREDTRAVSALVGAILLLAILIIALSSYQAVIVPNQNAQTEFDHNQQVEDEMVEFRNALIEARLDNRERAVSVKLGTRYQSRTLAVNPPPATGTLQNISQSNMRVINESGDGAEILNLTGNEFFEYEPSYSEYRDAGTIRYENLLVYHEFTSSNVMLSDQLLVRGDTIRLVPSEPSINENGVDRVTYEPEPTPRRFVTVDNPQLTIPTKLSPEEWRGLIDDDDYSSIEEGENNDEIVITFEGQKRVIYSIVENQDLDKITEDDDEEADPETEINPAGPNDIILLNSEFDGDDVTLTFRNLQDTNTFTEGRVSFYFNGPGGRSTEEAERVEKVDADGNTIGDSPRGQNWEVSGDFKDLTPPIEIEGDGALTRVRLEFDDDVNAKQDFFVVTFGLGTGERATYFVAEGGGADIGEENDNDNNFEFTSTSASQSGNDPVAYSFIVSAGSADIASVSVELLENGDVVDTDTYNSPDPREFSSSGELSTVGSGGSVTREVVFTAVDEDGNEITNAHPDRP